MPRPMARPKPETFDKQKTVAENRRARYDYFIEDKFEAGLMLTGTEVKSLRAGEATIAESYGSVDRNGELYLINATIPEYLQANRFNHEPKRPRKLLLRSREIVKLAQGVELPGGAGGGGPDLLREAGGAGLEATPLGGEVDAHQALILSVAGAADETRLLHAAQQWRQGAGIEAQPLADIPERQPVDLP